MENQYNITTITNDDIITIDASEFGGLTVDTITFDDWQPAPLVLTDGEESYDVLQELKDTKEKLAALEYLVDQLLEHSHFDSTVADQLQKNIMIKKLAGK